MHAPKTLSTILLSAALVAGLAACSGTSAAGGSPTATVTTTRTAAAASGSATPSPTCGPASGADAAARAIAALPLPSALQGVAHWDAANADVSGYDACAALSWAVVTVADGTPSSPYAILLFHDGAYLGTATATQYAFSPTVTRTADDAASVTYRYAQGDDANADPTGRTTATFTWDDATGKVAMTGSTPPAA